jgi:hypothetical protein
VCGGVPAASSVPCGECFGEFGDAFDPDTAAAGFAVPLGSTEVPFGEGDGFGCDDEAFIVSGVCAAHLARCPERPLAVVCNCYGIGWLSARYTAGAKPHIAVRISA